MKRLWLIPALVLTSPLTLAVYLAHEGLLEPEVLATYWIEPFLFGLAIGVGLAAMVFVVGLPNESSSGGQS